MSDITMCSGEKCPLKQICYRYTAKPNEFRQAYFMEPPVSEGECEHFWRAEPKKCKYVKREGESCTMNDNCTYPNCKD